MNCTGLHCAGSILPELDSRILYLNICSHYLELKTLIHHIGNPDFIILCETWLNKDNADLYGIDTYSHTYSIRQGKLGGGVSIF